MEDGVQQQAASQQQFPLAHSGLADQFRNADTEDELLMAVVRVLISQVAADWLAVYLADEPNKRIIYDRRYTWVRPGATPAGASHHADGVREVSWRSGALGRAARLKEGQLILGKSLDLAAKDVFFDFGPAESAAVLPLVVEGATVALLVAGRSRDELPAEDVLLLQLVQASAASHWSRIAQARAAGAANKPLQKLLQGLPEAAAQLRAFRRTFGRGQFLRSLTRVALSLIRAQGCLILTFDALTGGLFEDGCYFESEGNPRPLNPNDHVFVEIIRHLHGRDRIFIERDLSDMRTGPLIRLAQESQYLSCLVAPVTLFTGRESFLVLLSWGRNGFGKVEQAVASLVEQILDVLAVAHETADAAAYTQRTAVLAHQIAGITHEVRNFALNAALSSEFLVDDLERIAADSPTPAAAELTARLAESARVVHQEIGKVQRCIEILRQFRRRGEIKLSVRTFNLNALVQDIRRSLHDLYEEKDIKIDIKLDRTFDQPDCVISSDPDLLRECISNLLLNAIYFTPRFGRIELATQFNADHPSYPAVISVTDEGGGIHKSEIENIFEPFYSTKKKPETAGPPGDWSGTGLGLFLTKNNLIILGGEIEVYSVVASGSRFTIRLPLRNQREGKRRV